MDYRSLWRMLSRSRQRRLAVVLALAVVAAAAEATTVLLIEPVIRSMVGSSAGRADSTGPLIALGVVLLLKNVLVAALSWLKNRELFAIQSEVSERLLRSYIRGTNPALRGLDAGQRASFAITEPLQLVLNCYLPIITILAECLALLALTSALLLERPLETGLLAVLLIAGVAGFGSLTRRRVERFGHRRKDSDTERQELIRAVIESRAEVNGLGVSEEVLSRYRRPNDDSAAMTARKSFLTEVSKNVVEVLLLGAVGVIALGFAYSDGAELVSVLAMYGVAAYRAMPALNRVMVSAQSMRFGVATARTLSSILDAEDPEPPRPTPFEDLDGTAPLSLELAFDGFELRNGKRVLQGCSVHLTSGQICVIWGPSGSGKSTLLEAIVDGAPGLDIRLQGKRLDHGLAQMPGLVGVTAQSPFVLPGTLGENLTLAPSHVDARLDLSAALLDDDPSSVLDKTHIQANLDRPVHRHAVSGGQAQRISLTRALSGHNRIVLLDEPSSALDPASRDRLVARLKADRNDRILLIITHDPALREIADVLLEVGP